MRASSFASRRPSGFTLVEIMIVIVIVGLLAAMASQTFIQVKKISQATVLANNFRQYRDAFNNFALENGYWPDGAAAGTVPEGMEGALVGFDEPPLGDSWQWLHDDSIAAVSINAPGVDATVLTKVDERIDDGSLDSGSFVVEGDSYRFVVYEY